MYSKKQVVRRIVLLCIISALVGAFVTSVAYRAKNFYTREDMLVEARNLIVENYVDMLTPEQIDKMNDAALSAMVASLNDPYSYYFDMKTYDQFEKNKEEEYVGIGVNVSYNSEDKTLVVMAPTAAGPAEKAGVLPQDLIIGVDDMTLEKNGYNAIINHIKSRKEGQSVKLYISRGGTELTMDIVCAKLSLETITSKMLDDKVAYIKISEFKYNSVRDFSNALAEIQKNNAKGLIIDLRNNPGGYADSVIKMTDMLLPEGTIAYLEDNKGNKEYFKSDKKCINIPMVVLTNEGTASASELMAGSLQAYDKAEIVGMKTYGKAVGQAPYMLTDETAIYLTTARYFTPKGECIDKKGIEPDVKVDLPEELKATLSILEYDKDTQLQIALETLYSRMQ